MDGQNTAVSLHLRENTVCMINNSCQMSRWCFSVLFMFEQSDLKNLMSAFVSLENTLHRKYYTS